MLASNLLRGCRMPPPRRNRGHTSVPRASARLNELQVQLDSLLSQVRSLRQQITEGNRRTFPHPFEPGMIRDQPPAKSRGSNHARPGSAADKSAK
jgi:hypothetical protein